MSVPPRLRRAPLALLLLAVLAAVAGCTSAGASPTTPAQAAADQTVHLTVDGRAREYLLHPAHGLAEGARSALVVVLHQEGGTPEGVAAETELASLRDQGATLVYPAGVDHSWDAGACCGLPSRQGIDDVKFLTDVVSDVQGRVRVDAARTAMVGYSSGGMLTYRYVCARPGTLAAAVVVSGSLESPCESGIQVPDVLALHGRQDGTIGLEKSTFVKALGLAPTPVSGTLKELTASAGCTAKPALTSEPGAEVFTWSGCRGGRVEARVIADAGHGWGGLGASQRTSEFLRTHLLG